MSCHFIGYPNKLKEFRFYCPDRYTKIEKMGHAIFLEDEVIRGSTVSQEIRLEEKRVFVATPLIGEPFFSVPATATPIVQGNMVVELVVDSPVSMAATPVVGSPMAEVDEEEEPVF
jgi:hypothetical protein